MNSALVKSPPDKAGEGHLQRRKAAARNGTTLGGDSHFPFWEAQIFIRDAKTGTKPILRDDVRQRWSQALQAPLKMAAFNMNLWIEQARMSRCMNHATGVMPQLYGRKAREREVFLRGTYCKESTRDFFGRAGVNLSNTLLYETVQLSEMPACLTPTGRREREKKVQGNNLAVRSLFAHTQGLSGDGVDPAVMTSWVILETTRSAISCLSSSTCSPIRGIELSITCRKKENKLVRRFPGGRCLFQLTSHTNLLCVSTSLPTPLVTTPLHAEPCLTFLGVGLHLVFFGNGMYFPPLPIFLPFTTWKPSQTFWWLEAF